MPYSLFACLVYLSVGLFLALSIRLGIWTPLRPFSQVNLDVKVNTTYKCPLMMSQLHCLWWVFVPRNNVSADSCKQRVIINGAAVASSKDVSWNLFYYRGLKTLDIILRSKLFLLSWDRNSYWYFSLELLQLAKSWTRAEPRQAWYKVIYTKYSKHWSYTVAHIIDCVCRKC